MGRSTKKRIGKVLGQVPKAGARRPAGTKVNLVVGRK
jgi:beta-lactam-binding protein with PASTA domain